METDMTILQLAALFLMMGVLAMFYAALAWFLTLLRRGRMVNVSAIPRLSLEVPHEAAPMRYAQPLPDAWRLPVQPGRPNDLIIYIEPEEKVIARRSNIERIITHLEEKVS